MSADRPPRQHLADPTNVQCEQRGCQEYTCLRCGHAAHPSLTCEAAKQLTHQWGYFLHEHKHLWGDEYRKALTDFHRRKAEAEVELS